ncbi:MAG: peptide chain release factor N(5)-glutamine methyltransferase [Lachnospiraceae bacterium]|nr:peptide chain release factor N(5)-glutamine methyltransferase [Lachnospiraceae bacterium]
MTYREALKTATVQLRNAQVPDADYDARELLFYVTGMTREQWLLRSGEHITEAESTRYAELLGRRAGREPLQQIIGVSYFMGLPFKVTSDTLCPRQDTELLAETAIPLCKGAKVLDMCTGTGCLAISIAKLAGPASVTAADLSKPALSVAMANAKANGADVTFAASDMFENVGDTYDVIVSNPPYIPAEQMESLMPEVKDYEPRMALYGGEDGLDFYRILTAEGAKHLRPAGPEKKGGYLIVEIGFDQGKSVPELFRAAGFSDVTVKKDYAGHDRVVVGHL